MKKILEQQEEKFKKEMEERDQDLLKKLKLSHESFYNNRYDRDSQLLKLIKDRDADQEAKTKEHIKGFKFLYTSMFKDFEKKMKDRDQELDDKDAYRRKVWLENLDLINNNLSKFLEVMTEMERNMNTLGTRQDDLNKKIDLTNELILEEQIERGNVKKKRRTEMKFPKFNPNLATLDLDPPNIFAPSSKRKKIDLPSDLFFFSPLPYCCSQLLHIIMNKTRKFMKKEMFACLQLDFYCYFIACLN